MEIARVGVEQRDLLLHGLYHPWMRMADQRNIVIDVQKRTARVVVKILHPAAHDLDRAIIGETQIGREKLAAGAKGLFERRERFRRTRAIRRLCLAWRRCRGKKPLIGQGQRYLREALKRSPRGSLGDGDVGVVRNERFAMRGVDDADGEPRGHQREKYGDFVVVQRKTPVISSED